jgi:hypothetical protein
MEALKSMSIDELWHLHEKLTSTLARRIAEQKAKLEERLRFLQNSTKSPIRRFVRNIGTQIIPLKNGPAVESNRIGCRRSSGRAKSSNIFSLTDKISGAVATAALALSLDAVLPSTSGCLRFAVRALGFWGLVGVAPRRAGIVDVHAAHLT